MKSWFPRLLDLIWRSLVVSIGYTITTMILGRVVPLVQTSSSGSPDFPAAFVGILLIATLGFLIGLTLGPIADRMVASRVRHVVVWGSVLFFNSLSVTIEGSFFAPERVSLGIASFAYVLLLALITAALVTWLFAPRDQTPSRAVTHSRPWYSWVWRFVVSSFSYLVFYFIFGAINYALVTKPYYESHAGGLTVPAPQVVFMAESVRAPLMTLAVLPFILSFDASRRRLAVLCGVLLFVIGGVIPLAQASTLPLFLLVASGWEIFFQNFLTGVVAALLLGFSAPDLSTKSASESSAAVGNSNGG